MVTPAKRLSMPLWPAACTLVLLALLVGSAVAVREALAHGYALWPPSQGLLALIAERLRLALWLAVGLAAVVAAPWLPRLRGTQTPARVALIWSGLLSVGLWAWWGYRFNRYRAAAAWRESTDWFGLRVPVALTQSSVLAHNLLLTALAILLAILLFFALRWLLLRDFRGGGRSWRLGALLGAALLTLLAAKPAQWGRPQAQGPDIILISLDAFRADRMRAYGGAGITPALDSLALRSEVFERAYSQEPWTLTSHMSMLTGLYPDAHGLDFGRALPAAVWTLAERLREAGYRTAASVRDCFLLSPRFGYAAGFDRYEEDGRDAHSRCSAAADWLLAERRPAFLFLHLYDPHSDTGALPYDAPQAWLPADLPEQAFAKWAVGQSASELLRQVNERQRELPESLAVWIPPLYDAGVRATDAALGELFARLRAAGRLRSAWIVIVADHGEALGERGHWMHEELMQSTLHIPLIVHRPDDARAGTRRSDLAETVDLMPTLLEAAGLPRESISQGQSLSGPTQRRFAAHRSGPRHAITTLDGWRLEYEFAAAGFRPLALRRVDGSGADGPDQLADSLAIVDAWIEPITQMHRANAALAARWRGGAVSLDRADEELLRSLGYID